MIGLSDAAFRAHVSALCYCNRHLTDGHVPAAMGAHADELVAAGVWHVNGNGFVIHDFSDYQPTGEEAARIREIRREAGRKGGLASAKARLQANQAKPKQVAKQTPSKTEAKSNPVPVPDTEPQNLSGSEAKASSPRKRDEVWDALEALFGTVPPKTNAHGKRNKACADLKRFDATSETIRRAHHQWAAIYPGATCTDTALATHYPQLLRPQSEEEAASWARKAELEEMNARYERRSDAS